MYDIPSAHQTQHVRQLFIYNMIRIVNHSLSDGTISKMSCNNKSALYNLLR